MNGGRQYSRDLPQGGLDIGSGSFREVGGSACLQFYIISYPAKAIVATHYKWDTTTTVYTKSL